MTKEDLATLLISLKQKILDKQGCNLDPALANASLSQGLTGIKKLKEIFYYDEFYDTTKKFSTHFFLVL